MHMLLFMLSAGATAALNVHVHLERWQVFMAFFGFAILFALCFGLLSNAVGDRSNDDNPNVH